jgi:hypothetical protein
MAAKKTTAAKIKEAKGMAAYRQKDVNQLQTGRRGDISEGPKGGIYVASQKSRTKAFNSLTSSAKTAGRAKNVESKLKKAASSPKLKQTNLDKTAGSRKKSGGSLVSEVAKRYKITAREARDIATALGTAAQSTRNPNTLANRSATKMVVKQVKEAAVAAATGKKGTTSPRLRDTGKKINLLAPGEKNNPIFRKQETMPIFKYQKGTKRK